MLTTMVGIACELKASQHVVQLNIEPPSLFLKMHKFKTEAYG
jgi:hypothetical protein